MLFVGDDWAEDHHDVEVVDDQGRSRQGAGTPASARGVRRHCRAACADRQPSARGVGRSGARPGAGAVKVGIETDRGPWVAALVAAGYEVFAINPLSVARYRERHSTSGAKSDTADAHLLAEIVRLDAPTTGRSRATPKTPRRSSWSPAATKA